jgi:phenylacetate-CoA ligase
MESSLTILHITESLQKQGLGNMGLYARTLRSTLPFMHFLLHREKSAYLKELEKSQWLSPNELRDLQWRRLKAMLSHAHQNVPFYHSRFEDAGLKPDDIKEPSDLTKLPVLTKDDVRTAVASREILARNIPSNRFKRNSSGGSTGKPLEYFNDKIQLEYRWASTNRNMEWTGYKIGDKYAQLWSDTQYLARSATLKERASRFAWRRKILSAYRMDKPTMEEYFRVIKAYKPKLIVGYASALYLFAKFIESQGLNEALTKAVISSAETLYPEHRKVMEHAFNCKIFNRYGAREFSTLAHECEQSQLHTNAENLFTEIIEDGEHAALGESGEIIVTDLHNFCMPFIRYRIEDVGSLSDEKCACGRGLPTMDKVEGRVHDVLVGEGGRYIPGEFFPHLFKDLKGIEQFQVVQEKAGELVINVVKVEGFDEKQMNEALAVVRKYFGQNIRIKLEFVQQIPLTKSGKLRYTICNVPIKLV